MDLLRSIIGGMNHAPKDLFIILSLSLACIGVILYYAYQGSTDFAAGLIVGMALIQVNYYNAFGKWFDYR